MKAIAILSLLLISAAAAIISARSPNVELIAFAAPNGSVFTTLTQPSSPHPTTPHDNTDPSAQPIQVAAEQAYTKILTAIALPTILPGKSPMYIHPFSYEITVSCNHVDGVWRNGDFEYSMDLSPGYTYQIDPRGGFPTFTVGPFDRDTGRMRFKYRNGEFGCEWGDEEWWRSCGECRVREWEGDMGDCTHGGDGGVRRKRMDCSFILGYVHQFGGGVRKSEDGE